jgi:NitT/TauT family transport system permease protein
MLTSADFYRNLLQSLFLTIQAMLYSIVIACLLGYMSTIPVFKAFVNFITKLRYLTLVGLVFSFTVIFKDGDVVGISLLMFGIIPFFVLSLLSSIEGIEQKEFDVCKTIGMNQWETLWELVVVGRLEQTVETIRANFAIAWLMITLVETYNMSKGGVGVMLYIFNKYNQLESIFAIQIIIFLVGLSFDYILSNLRHSLFPHTKLNKKK